MPDRDELDELWCGQPIAAPAKGEDMLAIALKKTDSFDRMIRLRNWFECGACVLLALSFAGAAWDAPQALVRAGNLAVAASMLWIVFYLLRWGRETPAPAPDQSLADFQRALLRKYDHQIRLLKNVEYWYLLPPYTTLLLLNAAKALTYQGRPRPFSPELVAMIIYTLGFGAVWFLNEGVAVGKLRRQRAQLIEEMDSRDSGE